MYENEIPEKFRNRLPADEEILWFGKSESGTTPAERGNTIIDIIFPVGVIAIVIYMSMEIIRQGGVRQLLSGLFAMAVFGFVCLLIIFRTIFGFKRSFAITNKRLVIMKNSGSVVRAVKLEELYTPIYKESARGKGFVKVKKYHRAGSKKKNRYIYIHGVSEPAVPFNILSDAMRDAKEVHRVQL